MGQVWPKSSISYCACNGMAVDAGVMQKHRSAFLRQRITRYIGVGWLLLLFDPRGEVVGCLRIDSQQHLGMLHAAVLRALA
jgi:hypothetical protein